MEVSHRMPFLDHFWMLDSRLVVIEYPEWYISSDGTSLIKEGAPDVTMIEPNVGYSTPVSWSVLPPDAGRVLYAPTLDCAAKMIFNRQAQDMLQVICRDGNELTTVAQPQSLGDVTWSLDGTMLAFHAGEEIITWDSWHLYLWQRQTEEIRRIEIGQRSAVGITFSPDGRWLAFQDNADLCVVNVGDENVTCFEDYLTAVGGPVSWSFDSQSIVLATCASGVCSQVGCDCAEKVLVTVTIPDGEITVLTENVDAVPSPIWGS
jgi:hypothetical protein